MRVGKFVVGAVAAAMVLLSCSFDDTPPLGRDAVMVLEATSVPSGWDAQRGPRPSGFSATQTYVATSVVASDVIPPNGFLVRAAEGETVLLSAFERQRLWLSG